MRLAALSERSLPSVESNGKSFTPRRGNQFRMGKIVVTTKVQCAEKSLGGRFHEDMMRGVRKASFMKSLGRIVTKVAVYGLKGFVVGYCVLEYGIEVTQCTGPSMEPTIQTGDYILVEKLTKFTKSFGRGDIVICRSPSEPNSFLCKRLIGLPGDLLTSPEIGYQTVPKGRVWLQGDNYINSYDSRNFGAVPMALLKGRAIFKLNTWKPLQ